MFQLLLESRASRRPPVGGSVVATAGHAALVLGLVAATADRPPAVTAEPETRARLFVATPVLPPPPASPREASSSAVAHPASAAPTAPTAPTAPLVPLLALMPAVLEIPAGVPDVDLTRHTRVPSDFARRSRSGVEGGTTDDPGSPATGLSILAEDQVDRPVLLAPGTRPPMYPESLRAAGLSGIVLAEFVVDTAGRIEPGSVRVVDSDHPMFSDAVRRTLPAYRFLAAEVSGRKVRQLVRLPFRFAVSPD